MPTSTKPGQGVPPIALCDPGDLLQPEALPKPGGLPDRGVYRGTAA